MGKAPMRVIQGLERRLRKSVERQGLIGAELADEQAYQAELKHAIEVLSGLDEPEAEALEDSNG